MDTFQHHVKYLAQEECVTNGFLHVLFYAFSIKIALLTRKKVRMKKNRGQCVW